MRKEVSEMADGPVVLPTFRGYTIDVRLQEFRKADLDQGFMGLEFIPFHSEAGRALLEAWYQYLAKCKEEHGDGSV
jgi:hypothetical protein